MRIRKQDPNTGDMLWGHGQNDFYIDQPEGVGQLVETRLLMSVGDYFLDTSDGTPYNTQVLGYGTIDTRDLAIQDRILGTQAQGTPLVSAITAFGSNNNTTTRALTQTATISTIFGETTVSTGPR